MVLGRKGISLCDRDWGCVVLKGQRLKLFGLGFASFDSPNHPPREDRFSFLPVGADKDTTLPRLPEGAPDHHGEQSRAIEIKDQRSMHGHDSTSLQSTLS